MPEEQQERVLEGSGIEPAYPGRAVISPTASLWRIREYLRPYYGQLAVMLAAALIGAGTEIVIPLLTKAAIDGPIAAAGRGITTTACWWRSGSARSRSASARSSST